jgi:hypothetical protein
MPLDPLMAKAIGELLAEHEADMLERLTAIRSEFGDLLAELPQPEPGEPGRKGRDGIDRVLAAPATVGPEQACEHNTIAHHRKGIWQAIRDTTGDPTTDPAGWKCLVPGVAAIETEQSLQARSITARFITSDGASHEVSWKMPATYLPHDWQQQGMGIIAGDILREGDNDFVALTDSPGNPLDEKTAGNWSKVQVIGRRGRQGDKGNKGDEGPPGPGLAGMTLVRDPAGGSLAILPAYADKRVKPEPIAIDLMVEPVAQGRSAIVGFAGPFHAAKRYGRGDVVSARIGNEPGLWLSLKPDNRTALGAAGAWQRMI